MTALLVEDLWVSYGKIQALRRFGLRVPAGAIVALIGSNGAGKTTALAAISGLRPLDRGRVVLDGEDVTAVPAHALVPRGLVHVPEGRRIFGRLTVRENLDIGAFARDDSPTARARDLATVLELFPRLGQRLDQLAGTLSGGEQQMLAMGRALMSGPAMILLDEPSMGLAPQVVDQVFDAILAINRMGVSVLLVEQNAVMALEIAAYAYVLQSGEITLRGTGRELLDSPAVREAYLG
jgi:branched-chain amino acid transport system ATP-binding protein